MSADFERFSRSDGSQSPLALPSWLRQVSTLEGLDVLYRDCLGALSYTSLDDLKNPQFVSCLSSIDLIKPVNDAKFAGMKDPMIKLVERITNERIAEYNLQLNFYGGILPADTLTKLRRFPESLGFNLFDDADVHIWANNANLEKYGKPIPHYVIPPDDPERATEIYIEMINSAQTLSNEISQWQSSLEK